MYIALVDSNTYFVIHVCSFEDDFANNMEIHLFKLQRLIVMNNYIYWL